MRTMSGLNRSSLLGACPGLAGAEVLLGEPVGHRAAIEGDGLGDLRGGQSLVDMQVLDLAEAGIIDHDNTSQICLKTALRSTGSSAPGGAGRSAVGRSASRSR